MLYIFLFANFFIYRKLSASTSCSFIKKILKSRTAFYLCDCYLCFESQEQQSHGYFTIRSRNLLKYICWSGMTTKQFIILNCAIQDENIHILLINNDRYFRMWGNLLISEDDDYWFCEGGKIHNYNHIYWLQLSIIVIIISSSLVVSLLNN